MYRVNPTISGRQLDGSLILHDSSSGKAIQLNQSAALIFCLCGGGYDEDAIFQELRRLFKEEDERRLRDDLARTLSQLRVEQVIVGADDK